MNMLKTFKALKFKDVIVNEGENASNVQGGNGEKCDLSLLFKSRKYFLEVKHSDLLNNCSNYPKQMITEMLMNKKNCPTLLGHYSLFVDYDSSKRICELLSFCRKHIRKREWIWIGFICRPNVIFLFDEKTNELFTIKWCLALNEELEVTKIMPSEPFDD